MSLLVSESMNLDPSTGSKLGDTTWISTSGGYIRFQIATSFTNGQFEYTGDLGQSFDMTCDFWAGGGSGADATYFYWGATATPNQENSAQNNYSVALSEFSSQVQLYFNGTLIASQSYASLGDSTWRTVHITVESNTINVYVNNVLQISFTDTARILGGTKYGWAGRSGGGTDEHRARNLFVSSISQPQKAYKIDASLGALNSSQSSSQLVRTSTNNLYAIIASTLVGNRLRVYKSTDNGASWTRQDYRNSPVFSSSQSGLSIAIDGSDVIHVIFVDAASTTRYVQFTTSSNTFGRIEKVPSGNQNVAIAVDSNNIPHVSYADGAANLYYNNRSIGFWKTPITVVSALAIPQGIDIQIDQNNVPQISMIESSGGLQVFLGNKNDASSFTSNTIASSSASTVNGGTSLTVDSSGNTWLAYQGAKDSRIVLTQHIKTNGWTTWQTAVTDNYSGKNVSLAADPSNIYLFYERNVGGLAYDRYDIVNQKWLGEIILQAATPSYLPHNPFVKWSQYFNNGDTAANNTNQQTIEYLFDDGSTVYYDKLVTAQISTGLAQINFTPASGATTTSTSSTSSSTSTSISTSSTSSSTSTSISTSSTSSSISTSSTSQSTSISTSSTSKSTSTSSTSSSISTSSTSSSLSTSSTSSSISTSSTSSSTSFSTSSTSSSTSHSTSSTSSSTSLSTSSTSSSISTSSTSSSISTSTSQSTSTSHSTSSTSSSTSLSTSSTSSSISTSSTSSSISTSSTSHSTSLSTSSTSSSTSFSTSSTSSSTSVSTSSTSSSISTSSTSSSLSTSSTSSSTSQSTSISSTSSSTSTTLSFTTSTSSTSSSTSTSSTSSSTSTSISTSSTSQSTSTSFSTSSTSSSISTSLSTSSTSSSISTSVSTSSTSSSTSTSTTLIDINMIPRAFIRPDNFYPRVRPDTIRIKQIRLRLK